MTEEELSKEEVEKIEVIAEKITWFIAGVAIGILIANIMLLSVI